MTLISKKKKRLQRYFKKHVGLVCEEVEEDGAVEGFCSYDSLYILYFKANLLRKLRSLLSIQMIISRQNQRGLFLY